MNTLYIAASFGVCDFIEECLNLSFGMGWGEIYLARDTFKAETFGFE